jgi:hypothetical protein
MPQSWAQGSIQGIELRVGGDPVLCFIVDGANLQGNRFVNNRIAANGTVHTQGFDNQGRGRRFGLFFPTIPVPMFQQIIASINGAIDNQETISIDLEDDFQAIDREVQVDGSEWLTYPQQITNELFIDDVGMRFITT